MRTTTKLVRNLNDAVSAVEEMQDSQRTLRASVEDMLVAHYACRHSACPRHGDIDHTSECCAVWRARMTLAELEVDPSLPSTPLCHKDKQS